MRKLLLTMALATFPFAASAGTTFTDNTFSDLGSYDITQGLVNGGASITSTNCATCGPTSGPALQITSTFPNSPVSPNIFTTVEVLLNPSFVYTPSTEGAITTLSSSVDKNLSVNILLTGAGNTFHPTIEQDGVLYVASISGPPLNNPPGSTGYNIIGADLTAANFLQFDPTTDTFGTGTPNFNGDPVEFGLTQIFGAGAAEIITADYANMSFAINGGAGTVPEPSTWALMLVGFIGLGFAGYRQRRVLMGAASV